MNLNFMKYIYSFLYLIMGYTCFSLLYKPQPSDGTLQIVAIPAIIFFGFTGFIFLFLNYLNFWMLVNRSRYVRWLLKHIVFPIVLLWFVFPIRNLQDLKTKFLIFLLVFLIADFFDYLEAIAVKIYMYGSKKYPDQMFNGGLPKRSSDLIFLDVSIFVVVFILIFTFPNLLRNL